MKLKRTLLLLALCCTVFAIGCKKGEQGPAGNANVEIHNFGSQTITTGVINYTLKNISRGKIDSSLILVYYNPSIESETSWYPIPSIGSGNLYQTRYFLTQSGNDYSLGIRILKMDGVTAYTTSITFTKLKVVIAPASSIHSSSINKGDYNSVKQYLQLTDN